MSRRNLRHAALRVAALSMTVALAACGGGSDPEPKPSTPSPTPSAPSPSPTPSAPSPAPTPPAPAPTPPAPAPADPGAEVPDPIPEPSGAPTSEALIDAAQAGGQLGTGQALLYKLYADFGDSRLPAQYAGDDAARVEGDADRQAAAWIEATGAANVPAQTLNALMPFFVPPYLEGSWWHQQHPGATALQAQRRAAAAGTPQRRAAAADPNCRSWSTSCSPLADWRSVQGTHVVVWYEAANEAGDKPNAEMLVHEFDTLIWPKLTGTMGREPLSDVGTGIVSETDPRLDVVLVDLPGGAEGKTVTLGMGCKSRPSIVYLKRDLATSGLKAQAAHEFMHVLQYTVPVAAGCANDYKTTIEATAAWASHHAYPDIKWEKTYAKAYLWDNWVNQSYDQPPADNALFRYGAYVLPLFLETRFGAGIVKSIWDKTTERTNELSAIDGALVDAGSSFAKEWPKFIAANWNRETIRTYRDVGLSERADPNEETTFMLGGSGSKSLFHEVTLAHAASAYYRVVLNDSAARSLVLINGWTFEASVKDLGGLGNALFYKGMGTLARQGLSLQVFLKVGGSWQSEPVDLSKSPWVHVCRDNPAGKIDEMIFMYGNAEISPSAPNYGEHRSTGALDPGLLVTNIGCRDWTGSMDLTRTLSGGNGGTEHMRITGIRLKPADAYPGAAPVPGSGPAEYALDPAANAASPGFGWVYKIAAGTANWTYDYATSDCTHHGSSSFGIAGDTPMITSTAWTPPGAAERGWIIPGLLNNPSVLQTAIALKYNYHCVHSDGSVDDGTTQVGTGLQITVLPNDSAVRVDTSGLAVRGTGAQSANQPASTTGTWSLQGATN